MEMFARVDLRTLPRCQRDWRMRMAGGELRLGTRSTYMGRIVAGFQRGVKARAIPYHRVI